MWNEVLKQYVPVGWRVCPLTAIASWNGGSQPPKSQHISKPKAGYIRFIQNRDYAGNNHLTYIPISNQNKVCSVYDIMVDKYGDAGKTRFGIAGAYNVALSKIDVKLKNGQEFIRAFLSSDAVKQYLSGACMASTRASLNEDTMSFLNVCIPPDEILQKFESFAKSIIQSILKTNDETRFLTNLRDWLLPMLMNGQATIAD